MNIYTYEQVVEFSRKYNVDVATGRAMLEAGTTDPKDVTPSMRQAAKMLNHGSAYAELGKLRK